MGLIGVCYMKQKHQTNENYHRKMMRKVKRNLWLISAYYLKPSAGPQHAQCSTELHLRSVFNSVILNHLYMTVSSAFFKTL